MRPASAPRFEERRAERSRVDTCRALGVDHLLLRGEHAPGAAVTTLVGGCWDGATVLSKSGAFGDEAFWTRLLAGERTGGRG